MTALYGVHHLQHHLTCFPHQFITRLRPLFIEMVHFVAEDLVGELGLDLADTYFGEIAVPYPHA